MGIDLKSGTLKTDIRSYIVWYEIKSRFGEPGGIPPRKILRNTPWEIRNVLQSIATHLAVYPAAAVVGGYFLGRSTTGTLFTG